jgi:hypothetical protein
MLTKIQFWLFGKLLVSLKTKIVDGTVNLLKVVTPKELLEFAKLFTRRQSFVREIRTVDVKKGTRRYTLLFVTTMDGTTRINLGRHRTIDRGFETFKPAYQQ